MANSVIHNKSDDRRWSSYITSNKSYMSFEFPYLRLCKSIGIISVALPFVLAIGKVLLESPGIQPSISDYYYTVMRGVYVGSLCAIGILLMIFPGYDRQDDIAGNLAGFFLISAALFPTVPNHDTTSIDRLFDYVHYGSSAAFFLTMAYFCIVVFRKTDAGKSITYQKRLRNRIYLVCGSMILCCSSLVTLNDIFLRGTFIENLMPVFWLESITVLAIGVSWLTKGKALFKD